MNPNGRIRLIFKDIIEAISGTDRDFTRTSIRKAIFLLAIPMVLEMIMESIFAVVDIYFVSKLNTQAVETVGMTESMMTIIYAIGIGIAMSTTAMVSRRTGEKDTEGASITAFQSILLAVIIGLVLAIPGIFFASDLLQLMGASVKSYTEYSSYTAILIGSNVIILLLFIINAVFRSSGDAAISMRVLFVANGLNIVLDPCLIFGLGPFPEMGVEGAAIATTIGRGIGVIYQFYLLGKGKKRVQILLKHMKIKLSIIYELIKISLGGIGQYLIATSSWIILMRIMSEFGHDSVAGYTIGIRIILFTILPAWGISNAASTLVGQHLGAKQPDEAEKAVWMMSFINMVFMGILGLFILFLSNNLMYFFIENKEAIRSGSLCLRIIGLGYIFYAFGMVMSQAFNGAGDTRTPTIINFFAFYIVEIPLAYLLAIYLNMDEQGVYISIVVAEALMAVIGIILFRRGKWKEKKV